jgi:hypothetical protein
MGVLIAALPGVTVAIVVIVVALLAVGAVVFVAARRHSAPDPPLQNEVLGEWFEPDTAGAEANGSAALSNVGDPAPAVAAEAGAGAAATGGMAAVAPSSAWTPAAPSAMRTEVATEAPGESDIPTSAYSPHTVDDTSNGASSAVPAAAAGAVASSNGWPASAPASSTATEPDADSAADGDGQPAEPFAGNEFDYGSLERDLGFTERTGGALAIGIASVILVVLLGLWLVAATHHGAGTPVQIVHTPIPGPPGPQGSPAP